MRLRAALIACAIVAARAGAAAAAESEERNWKATATALAYFIPEQSDFVMLIAPV